MSSLYFGLNYLREISDTEMMSSNTNAATGITRVSPCRRLKFQTVLAALVVVPLAILLVLEGALRLTGQRTTEEGAGCAFSTEADTGWGLSPGTCHVTSSEYEVDIQVNELGMNDAPYRPAAEASCTRILALGDSHTQATGVQPGQAWPKKLQELLAAKYPGHCFRVYNGGVAGYNLHQYYFRLRHHGPRVKPDYVVVGFTFSSDLYDLLPPNRGGWSTHPQMERPYFDLDRSNQLVEVKPVQREIAGEPVAGKLPTASTFRNLLNYSYAFRSLRRSTPGLWLGSRLRIFGGSMWPNMEVLLETRTRENNEYNWKLARELLKGMRSESNQLGAKFLVVGMPFFPQIYDEVWNLTFGAYPDYSRDAGNRKLADILSEERITYLESLPTLINYVKQHDNRWITYRVDAHPTPEYHEVLAKLLSQDESLKPVR